MTVEAEILRELTAASSAEEAAAILRLRGYRLAPITTQDLHTQYRARLIRRLLAQKTPRRDIARYLLQRGVCRSRSTAYRAIGKALSRPIDAEMAA